MPMTTQGMIELLEREIEERTELPPTRIKTLKEQLDALYESQTRTTEACLLASELRIEISRLKRETATAARRALKR